ncbi:hypothetical protein [Kribbella sp. NPDC006257]|uniref:Imm32 family immunity protein n=1 Tax=Kribbella sp. NPDC006257 TaxID=3156738 RepID=UPI0033B9E3E3
MTTEVAIRYSMRSNELDVSATREGLLEIADLVEAGDGRVVADDGVDPLPYDVCIPLLVVRRLAGGGVVIRVSKEMSDVTLEGGQDALRLLAENLRGLAVEGADDEHLHLEYFAGHFYLEEASVPAVVGLVGN